MFTAKINFLEDIISALRGCCLLKFSHMLHNDQSLLTHMTSGAGLAALNFITWCVWCRYDNLGTFFGGWGAPRKCGSVKYIQKSARFRTTSDFDTNISGTDQVVDKLFSVASKLTTIPLTAAYPRGHWQAIAYTEDGTDIIQQQMYHTSRTVNEPN